MLSLAMIVRDEEESIGEVLADAATFCDELVVVDTGSVDGTVGIAEAAGASVHHFDWVDDFSAARNHSFDQCHGEWILWLDADDRVPADQARGFRSLATDLQGTADFDAMYLPYRYAYRPEDPSICSVAFHRERLLRSAARLRWEGAVHEVIVPGAGCYTERDEPWVEHRPTAAKTERAIGRNLRILERSIRDGDRSERTLLYYGNELRDNGRTRDAIDALDDYLTVGTVGWERYGAHLAISRCAGTVGERERQLRALFDALAEDSSRAEAFNELGILHYDQGEWRKAIPFFRAAIAAHKPDAGIGFVNEEHYTWVPWDFLAVCLAQIGEQESALEAAVEAIADNPDPGRVVSNMHWSIDQLGGRGGTA